MVSGCKLFNQNKINDAHDIWEIIWKKGNSIQKNIVKGLIQLSGAAIQFERGKLNSVSYLLNLAIKNISKEEMLNNFICIDVLIADLKSLVEKLENNNLKEIKINIKF